MKPSPAQACELPAPALLQVPRAALSASVHGTSAAVQAGCLRDLSPAPCAHARLGYMGWIKPSFCHHKLTLLLESFSALC